MGLGDIKKKDCPAVIRGARTSIRARLHPLGGDYPDPRRSVPFCRKVLEISKEAERGGSAPGIVLFFKGIKGIDMGKSGILPRLAERRGMFSRKSSGDQQLRKATAERIRQSKLPCTPELFRMLIRRAGNAAGNEARIYCFCKFGIFNNPDRLAGVIGKPFSLPRRLNAAVEHPEHDTGFGLLNNVLEVKASIEPVLEALHQCRNTSARLDPQSVIIRLASMAVKWRQASVSIATATSIP